MSSIDFPARNSSPTRSKRRDSFGKCDSPKPLLFVSDPSPQKVNVDTPSSAELASENLEKKAKRRQVLILTLVGGGLILIVALAVGIAFLLARLKDAPPPKRNVILMISDGFGPASETFSRSYYQMMNNLTWSHEMPLDKILIGTSRTRSASSLVTDSAAGATAFSCVMKTTNEQVAVDVNKKPCGTLLEAAKASGMLTGLVATAQITDATPASFSSHVVNRYMENEIAQQQVGDNPLGRQVDVMMGGGRCHFMKQSTEGSCRKDERDLLTEEGWKFISSRKEFDNLDYEKVSFPLGGLFTLGHMSYDMDRNPDVEPSLKEMAAAALSILDAATKSSDKGFFIMIEGSRIDLAAHSKDAAAQVHDILAYQETITNVKEFVDSHPGTVMISVSDHETGGLTLARQVTETYPEYIWHPEVIARAKKSTEFLTNQIMAYTGDSLQFESYLENTIIRDGLGIVDATAEELQFLKSTNLTDRFSLESRLAELVNFRAQIGWTTHGHSGVDVNLYAYGPESEKLRGNHENTDIGAFIREYLSLDLEPITKRLNELEFIQRVVPNEGTFVAREIMNDESTHFHHVQSPGQDL